MRFLAKVKGEIEQIKQAHARAADEYMKHFKVKEVTDKITDKGKLGGYFVEARYHLVQAKRNEELAELLGDLKIIENQILAKKFCSL